MSSSTGWGGTASPVVLAVTALVSVVGIARKLRNKSTSLPIGQLQVLVALKAIGPTSPETITEALNRRPSGGIEWSVERLTKALLDLQSVRVRDGSVESYVARASDGLWSASAV